MERIVVYQKPTCTKCRQAIARLREAGADFEAIDYFDKPLSREKLKRRSSRASTCRSATRCGGTSPSRASSS